MKKLPLLLLTLTSLAWTSCKQDEVTIDCTGTAPTYSQQVQSILNANCAISGCHGAGSAQDGVSLANYSAVQSVGKTRLVGVIQATDGFPLMPPSGALPEAQIKQIYCWAENGMPQ